MYYSLLVSGAKRVGYLLDDALYPAELHSIAADDRPKCDALYELHDEVALSAWKLTGIENADNSGVVYSGQGFNLLLKLLLEPAIKIRLLRLVEEDFDDYRLGQQLLVARQVNYADAPAPQFALNEVTAVE
jgi:hypothetical protein